MTGKILDIEKWKIDYPFLKEVSNVYDEFDKNVHGDTKSYLYDIICGKILETSGGEITKHKDTCMKLLRNLGIYTVDPTYFNYNYDRCNILYNWIYNSIKKDKITDEIIKNCYYDYIEAKKTIQDNHKCIYHSYEDYYKEPENIMLLNVFKSYIGVTKNTMNGGDDILKNSCHKYICEFVNIYKNMNSKYCLAENPSDQKQQNTCGYLSTFKYNYMLYLYKDLKEEEKIPSLENVEEEYILKCQKDEQRPALQRDVHREQARFPHSLGGTPESRHTISSQPTVSNSDPNNSKSSTVSTAVGTVAGVSSVLALLYKFSPGGNWIRSGIRRNRGRIDSNFYEEGPNELLFDAFKGEDMSAHNKRYNIGYGTEGIYE